MIKDCLKALSQYGITGYRVDSYFKDCGTKAEFVPILVIENHVGRAFAQFEIENQEHINETMICAMSIMLLELGGKVPQHIHNAIMFGKSHLQGECVKTYRKHHGED